MLRALVVVLLLGNVLFFAWTRAWLDGVVGVRPIGDREPERLLRQVRPEQIKVLPPPSVGAGASSVSSAEPPSVWVLPDCHQIGPLDPNELPIALAALKEAWPTGRWTESRVSKPGRWAIDLGPFEDQTQLQQKQQALRQKGYTVEALPAGPAGEAAGLLLGRFTDLTQANIALAQWQKRGERDARVMEMDAPTTQTTLRMALTDAALLEKLKGLTPLQSSTGQTLWADCTTAP
jgi:hypothetical protein